MNATLLHHAFEVAAARRPGKTALVDGSRRLSYSTLREQQRSLAALLAGAGVRPGDRVLVMLGNQAAFAVAVHAVLAAGAVFVPVSEQTKADKLAFLLADTGARALVVDAMLAPVWVAAIRGATALRAVVVKGEPPGLDRRELPWPQEEGGGALRVVRSGSDLAALIYTSGTTARPKGVMLSHRNMTSAWSMVQAYLGLREDDVIALALPAAYSYGLYMLLMGLGTGATVVLERQAAFPAKLAETLERERATVLPGVPTLFAALLALPALERYDLGALRLITNAAAALPEPHLRRLRAAFAQARFYSMYGLTECKRASYLDPEELDRRPASVGRELPPRQVHWLVDDAGRHLPHGSTGELVVCGPHVMRGYWRRPEETARRLRRDPQTGRLVLHTGDLFRSDADGYLYFVSRLDDLIKTRGEKVAPREVESVIYALAGVSGCAVVGVPDAVLGESVKAFVALEPGCALKPLDIVRHCMSKLESHMVPREVEIVAELPRTDSGKIRHASLRCQDSAAVT